MASSSSSFHLPEWRIVIFGAALFTAGLLTHRMLTLKPKPHILESPMKTVLPRLSSEEISQLPYPPDFIPGGRSVETPYGTIRAYEFGPEDGHKVLFVHGISTPCLALAAVANSLAEKGYRVMLFDLFGRGYSDTPLDLSQDLRLFTTQILCVLASSPLSWTGSLSNRFSLIGYSLGGAIAVGFAAYLPGLVSSLILIAPAGVIRQKHISRTSKILYSDSYLFLEPVLQRLVKRRLRAPLAPPQPTTAGPNQDPEETETKKTEPLTPAQAEVSVESNPTINISEKLPNISVLAAVQHQVEHHTGFVPAFMSSMRSGLPLGQEDLWRKVGRHFSDRNQAQKSDKRNGLRLQEEKVLILCGEADPIIIANELKEDADELFGGLVDVKVVEGADHGLPVNMPAQVVQLIEDFWWRQSGISDRASDTY